MKNTLLLITILLAVSCGKGKEAQTYEKVTEDNNTKPINVDDNATKPINVDDNNATKPVKELTKEDVVGEYERNYPATGALKQVFLDNGIRELHVDGKKKYENKWKIVDGKIHIDEDGDMVVYRINPDRSITGIAVIDKDGKRTDYEFQLTYKKIK